MILNDYVARSKNGINAMEERERVITFIIFFKVYSKFAQNNINFMFTVYSRGKAYHQTSAILFLANIVGVIYNLFIEFRCSLM